MKIIRRSDILHKSLLIILAFLCFSLTSFSRKKYNKFERIYFETIRIEQGLSQNYVYSMIQDQKGYMWFGTWDGLNKFNGYNFTVYKSLPNNQNSLSNSRIHAICEDKAGNIWLGTDQGLNKFDRNTQSFKHYINIPGDKTSISDNAVWSVIERSSGEIWVGTDAGLNKFNPKTEKFTHYLNNPGDNSSLSNDKATEVFEDKDGNLWIATGYGLNKYDLKSGTFKRYFHDPGDSKSLSGSNIRTIFQDKKGGIWVGTTNGLNKYLPKEDKFINYKNNFSKESNNIYAIYEDKDNYLWLGTYGGGLVVFNPVNNKSLQFKHDVDKKNSLCNDKIYFIYEDNSGVIWIGTRKGISKVTFNKFNHFHMAKGIIPGLKTNVTRVVFVDDKGLLWIGTEEGIVIYNRKTGESELLRNEEGNINSLSFNYVRSIIQDKKGDYWIGTFGGGLNKYEKDKNKFTIYRHIPGKNSLSDNALYCVLEDGEGYLWIGTTEGLNRLKPETGEFKIYKHKANDPHSISHDIILSLYMDKDNTMWVCSYEGLNKYDRNNDSFIVYKSNHDDNTTLSSNNVRSIIEDKEGIFWIGTKDGGLNRFNKNTGKFKSYTVDDGLPNNVVYVAVEDENSNLWISTNFGLSKFNIKDEFFVNYDITDGVQGYEFNSSCAFKSKKGELFFGGMNGFNSFYPKQIKKNNHIPDIVITAFKIFNVSENVFNEYKDGDTIVLSYKDNFFSFEFAALDYDNSSKNKYIYKLENYDDDWISCKADRRYAEYKRVGPGNYIFKVRGSNNDSVWNTEGVSLVIIITPPWYQTRFFQVFMVIFVLFIAWLVIFLHSRRIKKKHAIEMEKKMLNIEKQMFELEQKALRLQMNPHFIFNTLNSIQSFVIISDTDKAISYLAKFSKLMRSILSNSREAYISIKDELKALSYYMDIEKLRFDDKFEYTIDISPDIDQDFMSIPPMIIQPYVENAIIHGIMHKAGRGEIIITLSKRGKTVLFTIEDDGIGREKAKVKKEESGIQRKSRGMLITQERLEILNKQNKEQISVRIIDLENNKGEAIGTRVEITTLFKEL